MIRLRSLSQKMVNTLLLTEFQRVKKGGWKLQRTNIANVYGKLTPTSSPVLVEVWKAYDRKAMQGRASRITKMHNAILPNKSAGPRWRTIATNMYDPTVE